MHALQDDPDRDYGKKARRREAELARRAQRSGFVRELVADIEGAPEEVRIFPLSHVFLPALQACCDTVRV